MSKSVTAPKPGFFGHFPAAFGLYLRASSPDKKNHYLYLGTNKSTPVFAFTKYGGLKRTLQAILHSTSEWRSEPLALFGIEGIWRGTPVITLPALSQAEGTAPRVERVKNRGGFKEDKWSFTVPVGSRNNLQDQTFE